jgi:hypothetical protein
LLSADSTLNDTLQGVPSDKRKLIPDRILKCTEKNTEQITFQDTAVKKICKESTGAGRARKTYRLWNQKSKWYYVLMYKNGKMRPLETILRMGGRRIKENGGGGEFS